MRRRLPPRTGSARWLAAAVIGVFVLSGCGGDGVAGPDGDLTVITTTSILGDVVGDLVGEAGTVTVLVPPGADPHGYAPSAAQVAALREADLVVANGLGLEEQLGDVLAAAEADGVPVVRVAEVVDPLLVVRGDDDHGDDDDDAEDEDVHGLDDGHDHEPGDFDPHVWFDPTRMAEGIDAVAAALQGVPDAADVDWAARADAVSDELLALDEEVRTILAAIPADRRRLVTNHDSLAYLATRYDLQVVATVIPGTSTQARASAADVAALADLVVELGIPAVFVDAASSADVARALAGDLDIEVVALFTGSLGGPGSGAQTYPDLLRGTARAIADALG